MRIAICLSVLMFSGNAFGDLIVSSSAISPNFLSRVRVSSSSSGFDDHNIGMKTAFDADLSGVLDTDDATIDYDAFSWDVPAKTVMQTLERTVTIPGTPPTPPFCDLSGCTPGDPGTPPSQVTETFKVTLTRDPYTISSGPTTVPVFDINANSASTSHARSTSEPIEFSWVLEGPTETDTGSFSLVTSHNASSSISLERNPPDVGGVSSWAPIIPNTFVIGFGDRATDQATVDGVHFRFVASIPEPSSFALLGLIGGLVAAYKRFA